MLRKARMDWADYLRDQAAKYRQLAETAEELSVKEELLDWAAICEEAAGHTMLSKHSSFERPENRAIPTWLPNAS
jgi:hypothetical protein